MIPYNVWAMLFRQSRREHPDRIDLQMPTPNPQPPDPPCSGQKDIYLGPLIHNMIIHSVQRRWGNWLPCLSTSKTLPHPLLIYHPNSLPIQRPQSKSSIYLRHLPPNQLAEVILSLYTGCTHISPFGNKCHSCPPVLSLAIITLSEPLTDPWEDDSQIQRGAK